MNRFFRIIAACGLVAAAIAITFRGGMALGQDVPSKPPSAGKKAPVQGYTRTNKHTGLPEQVRPHKRRPPAPKPVQVQPYTRGGQPVQGHQRQAPGKAPGTPGPADNKKTQSGLPRRDASRHLA